MPSYDYIIADWHLLLDFALPPMIVTILFYFQRRECDRGGQRCHERSDPCDRCGAQLRRGDTDTDIMLFTVVAVLFSSCLRKIENTLGYSVTSWMSP